MKVVEEGGALLDISKTLRDFNTGYTGLTFCPGKAVAGYKDACFELVQEGGGPVVEDVLIRLLKSGKKIDSVEINNFRWFEVDDEADYRLACELLKNNPDDWVY